MSQEKLDGGSSKKELRERRAHEKAAAYIAANLVRMQHQYREERGRFEDLNARNRSVISRVEAIVAGSPEQEITGQPHYWNEASVPAELHKTAIVVVGDHAKAKSKSGHTTICAVTLLKRGEYIQGAYDTPPQFTGRYAKSAAFTFALVSTHYVDHLVAHTDELQNPDRNDLSISPSQETPYVLTGWTEGTSSLETDVFGPLQLKQVDKSLRQRIAVAEKSLDVIEPAVTDPSLNPHLIDLAS